jgi:hypothetical protein
LSTNSFIAGTMWRSTTMAGTQGCAEDQLR